MLKTGKLIKGCVSKPDTYQILSLESKIFTKSEINNKKVN